MTEFTFEKDSRVPLYAQIAAWIETQIRQGALKEGDRLPAERKMRELTGANRDTVKRAYAELSRRGFAATELGSGTYVRIRELTPKLKKAELLANQAAKIMKQAGVTKHEAEYLFLHYIWNHLPEMEKVRLAWIDCSEEILADTARELQNALNVRVTPLLLDEVSENPNLLLEGGFDIAATTINHFDELNRMAENQKGLYQSPILDMVVLAVSPISVSRLAKIEAGSLIVVVYEGEWYRYSLECYLQEFSVKGKIIYVQLYNAIDFLKGRRERMTVILPQDMQFGRGRVEEVFRCCTDRGIPCIPFQQSVDAGSLTQLKKRVQKIWMERT